MYSCDHDQFHNHFFLPSDFSSKNAQFFFTNLPLQLFMFISDRKATFRYNSCECVRISVIKSNRIRCFPF